MAKRSKGMSRARSHVGYSQAVIHLAMAGVIVYLINH